MLQPCSSVAGLCLSKVSFCWWRVPNLKRFSRGGKYHPLAKWQASRRGTEKRGRSLGHSGWNFGVKLKAYDIRGNKIRGWHWDVGLRVPGCKSRFCVFIKWFDTGTACHVQAFRYKKPGFLPGTPLPPWMSLTTFYVRWHRILKPVMLIQGGLGGIPVQEFGLFVTAGVFMTLRFGDGFDDVLLTSYP